MKERNCDRIKRLEKELTKAQARIEAQIQEIIRIRRNLEERRAGVREVTQITAAYLLSITRDHGKLLESGERELCFPIPDSPGRMAETDLRISVDEKSRRIILRSAPEIEKTEECRS